MDPQRSPPLTKVGTQHLVEEADLDAAAADDDTVTRLPKAWSSTDWDAPMPAWERIVRDARTSH